MTHREEKLTFPGAHGTPLAARIDRPDHGEPKAWALFAHCFSCSKDLKAVGWLTRGLVEKGFGVLRFDFTGLGESDGDFADTNFSSNLDDLAAAAEFLRGQGHAPRLLVGHSLGGAAVIAVADRIPEAVAVATIGAPSDTAHLSKSLTDKAPALETSGEAQVALGGRPFLVKKQLLDDLSSHSLHEYTAKLGRALLVMHSPVDEIVGIEHARAIYEAAKHPKSFVSLDDADHLLLRNPKDARYVTEMLAAWASRYLDDDPAEKTEPAPRADRGEVLVRGGASGFAQEIHAGPHRLVADEPKNVPGATDTGPTPYDLLLAGLGACTSMTLRMYADRKGWPLTGVETRLRHSRIHADDCETCDTKAGRIDKIDRSISIEGDLDAAQRSRLIEIADRCPVHRTLTGEIVIETRETAEGESV